MSDPYAETDEWLTPSLPARPATHSPEQPKDGSTVTGDAEGAREARYEEAISARLHRTTDRWQGGFIPAVSADTTSALEAARAVMAVADEEQAALLGEVANLRMRYEASQGALSDLLTEHRVLVEAVEAAIGRAEQITPQGSPEWVQSGIAMRSTVLREFRAVLAAPPAAPEAAETATCLCGEVLRPGFGWHSCNAGRTPVSSGEAGPGEASSLRDELRKAADLAAERPESTKRRMPTLRPKEGGNRG